MKRLALIVLLLLLPALPAWPAGISPLSIKTADGRTLTFTVEFAQTPAELEQGLMNRPSMAADAGMLFDLGTDQVATFWMKNTLIPLDMLFIASDGTIKDIAERAVPLSLALVTSQGPVRAVLEVNGGTAERLNIKPGDLVRHAMFKN